MFFLSIGINLEINKVVFLTVCVCSSLYVTLCVSSVKYGEINLNKTV